MLRFVGGLCGLATASATVVNTESIAANAVNPAGSGDVTIDGSISCQSDIVSIGVVKLMNGATASGTLEAISTGGAIVGNSGAIGGDTDN